MKIIDFYIIKKFLGTFFYAISLLIVIVIIFDVSENIDEFLENDAPLNEIIFSYYLNFIPYFLNLFIYLFTFISVIFFTSKLASNTEIIAFLSSGVSFARLLRPYFISGLILAVFSFYLANFLIPKTNQKRRVFKDTYMEKLSKNKDRNIHLQIHPGTFVYVERFNTHSLEGKKFTIEKFKDHKLYYKLRAKSIKWDTINREWLIKDYYIRTIKDKKEKLVKGTRIDTTLNLDPSDLYVEKEDFEEMNFWELNRVIESKKMKGVENVKIYEVERSKRAASPFATLVMTFIGMSLSCRKVRGGLGMHLGLGIAIAFAFILFMQVSTVFATLGNLPPHMAAWIPNIIFGIIGIYLLITAPK
ncbi:MAG: LptF/LptG family permease [Bacteroidales bacterium]|nr:LptF/LptG family permease [Bacteroidales bacterium]